MYMIIMQYVLYNFFNHMFIPAFWEPKYTISHIQGTTSFSDTVSFHKKPPPICRKLHGSLRAADLAGVRFPPLCSTGGPNSGGFQDGWMEFFVTFDVMFWGREETPGMQGRDEFLNILKTKVSQNVIENFKTSSCWVFLFANLLFVEG